MDLLEREMYAAAKDDSGIYRLSNSAILVLRPTHLQIDHTDLIQAFPFLPKGHLKSSFIVQLNLLNLQTPSCWLA